MKTVKIDSLSNIQIYDTVLLVTMLYITSPGFTYSGRSVPFDLLHPFCPSSASFYLAPSPNSGNHQSVLFICEGFFKICC